jgi:lipopolysaccharide biosynthesis glycosyltransferase
MLTEFWHSFILFSIPSKRLLQADQVGVVTLIGHKHVYMFIFCFSSFLYYFKKNLSCTVVDDGTLTERDVTIIKRHFQGIHIILHKKANQLIYKKLLSHPSLMRYRRLKLIDRFNLKLTDPFLLTNYKKIIYMDCDILFFRKPKEILSWANHGYGPPLYIPERPIKSNQNEPGEWAIVNNMFRDYMNLPIDRNFNSGLICIDRTQIDLELIDKSIDYTHRVKLDRTWTPEQYSLSAVCAKYKAVSLGNRYRHLIRPSDLYGQKKINYTLLHFAYLTKPLFWKYAMRLIIKTRFFRIK